MKFLAKINIMPLKELLDPQGKAVSGSLANLGIRGVDNVRIGKHITLDIEASDAASAKEQVETATRKLLANLVMESYEIAITPAAE